MSNPNPLSVAIHNHIRQLGGYWQPLSNLARIIEEFGELCASVDETPINAASQASELADLFIVSTCLANQYSCHLAIKPTEPSEPIKNHYHKMAALIGDIARVVNYYEGDKKAKAGSKLPSLQKLINALHDVIYDYAKQNNMDLQFHIQKTIAHSVIRDKNRFATLYYPTLCESLDLFTETHSLSTAKIWGSPNWDSNKTATENLCQLIPVLNRFIKVSTGENLDGFVIAIPLALFNNANTQNEVILNLLQLLAENNPEQKFFVETTVGEKFFILLRKNPVNTAQETSAQPG